MAALSVQIKLALSSASGIHVRSGNLYVQFKLPDKVKAVRKAIGYPATLENIEAAKLTLANIKRDINIGLYKHDPDTFWERHFPTNTAVHGLVNISLRECFAEYREENSGALTDPSSDKMTTAINWMNHYNYADKAVKFLTKDVLEKVRKKTVEGDKKAKFSGCATSTVNEYTKTVKKVLDHAVDKGYIKINPVPQLKKLPKDDFNSDAHDDDVRPFSQAELDSLLKAIHVHRIRLMVTLLAWTGMRHGELKALAWEDIDFDGGIIHVKYNLTRKGKLKVAKTQAGIRKIEMLPIVQGVLLEQFKKTGHAEKRLDVIHYKNHKTKVLNRRRVFLHRDNQPYRRPEVTTKSGQWEIWLKKADIPYRPAYQLRHTYASRLLMANAKPTWLAQQMGHKDWSMISTIYAKWIPAQEPNYINTLAKALGQTAS
ncbi:tyrosine-type recombinase/integrase [Thalassotalea maritima]|uniref:tyrosine-type recombinase/integrase n=1 Tax=Thalassotalea maritima TaxID=3242416 RepID=UPI0035291BAA